MACKKCDTRSTVILRKKDFYCDVCFLTNTNHKFRACIGKNKMLNSNENVMLCLSGGKGSLALMDLVHHGISLQRHKKLRIEPICLHVMELNKEAEDIANHLINQCNKYKFKIHIIHIVSYCDSDILLSEDNYIPTINNEAQNNFSMLLKNLSPTAIYDFIDKVKRHLYIQCANQLGCNYIFTAETTTTLATNLLSNIALGRGSQVEYDIGFSDTRNKNITILRPMKDISKEELDYYVSIRHLESLCHSGVAQNSLQFVINNFVSDLQVNFPSTISTVCKTADKIGCQGDIEGARCIFCESSLAVKDLKLSSIDAIKISRIISSGKSPNIENQDSQNVVNMMFPFIQEYLCYGCCKNYTELDQSKLVNHITYEIFWK